MVGAGISKSLLIAAAMIPNIKNKSVGLVRLLKIRLRDIFHAITYKILEKWHRKLSIEGNFNINSKVDSFSMK